MNVNVRNSSEIQDQSWKPGLSPEQIRKEQSTKVLRKLTDASPTVLRKLTDASPLSSNEEKQLRKVKSAANIEKLGKPYNISIKNKDAKIVIIKNLLNEFSLEDIWDMLKDPSTQKVNFRLVCMIEGLYLQIKESATDTMKRNFEFYEEMLNMHHLFGKSSSFEDQDKKEAEFLYSRLETKVSEVLKNLKNKFSIEKREMLLLLVRLNYKISPEKPMYVNSSQLELQKMMYTRIYKKYLQNKERSEDLGPEIKIDSNLLKRAQGVFTKDKGIIELLEDIASRLFSHDPKEGWSSLSQKFEESLQTKK